MALSVLSRMGLSFAAEELASVQPERQGVKRQKQQLWKGERRHMSIGLLQYLRAGAGAQEVIPLAAPLRLASGSSQLLKAQTPSFRWLFPRSSQSRTGTK